MCVGCAATQVPVCAATGQCAVASSGGIISMTLLLLGVAIGTARLWLHLVTAKVAPFLNKEIKFRSYDKE